MKTIPPPPPVTPRRELARQQIDVPVPVVYRDFKHFQQKILPLKINGWSKKEDKDSIVFEFFQSFYTPPKHSLSVLQCYNDLKIATLRDVAPQSIEGNVSGRHSGKKSKWCNVITHITPLTFLSSMPSRYIAFN